MQQMRKRPPDRRAFGLIIYSSADRGSQSAELLQQKVQEVREVREVRAAEEVLREVQGEQQGCHQQSRWWMRGIQLRGWIEY